MKKIIRRRKCVYRSVRFYRKKSAFLVDPHSSNPRCSREPLDLGKAAPEEISASGCQNSEKGRYGQTRVSCTHPNFRREESCMHRGRLTRKQQDLSKAAGAGCALNGDDARRRKA